VRAKLHARQQSRGPTAPRPARVRPWLGRDPGQPRGPPEPRPRLGRDPASPRPGGDTRYNREPVPSHGKFLIFCYFNLLIILFYFILLFFIICYYYYYSFMLLLLSFDIIQ
jgi:hypothetical protein